MAELEQKTEPMQVGQMSRPKKLGILGGMGPLATAQFYRMLIERTPARADQEHVPVALWADPSVPDRSAALVGAGPSPVPALLVGLRWLEASGADCVAIPCNTAHAFLDELRLATDVEIIDMVHAALTDALAMRASRVGLLTTCGTRATKLYENASAQIGLPVVTVSMNQQSVVDEAIRAVKAGYKDVAGVKRSIDLVVDSLTDDGADVIIAACTELPLLLNRTVRSIPIIDSASSLVDAVLRRMGRVPGL